MELQRKDSIIVRRGQLGLAISVNDVPIRLTEERWKHIVNKHVDLLNYQEDILSVVEKPEAIYRGQRGTLIAIRSYGRRGLLAVFYRETSPQDGFIITARFILRRPGGMPVWAEP